jgi:hypothetical protein
MISVHIFIGTIGNYAKGALNGLENLIYKKETRIDV